MFFKKFFGKKNDGFYLQLEDDDAKSTSTAKAPAKTPAKADLVVPPAAPAAVAPAAVAAAPAAKADPKQVKADKKAAQAAKKAEAPKAEPAPTPVAAPPQPTITNFATDYLIKPSSNSGRRRPGANMRQFVDLARQMEKPKAFKATAAERKPEKPSVEKPSAEKPNTEKAAESSSK
ncbi:hypothetical protein [Chamaesiphon sp. VAR_69_metabat_338]|uniref:hypothetical protein n=1 Tax=Chamaesiphon sp. VAR_69_metabat_338 TaxID=2964704 RepID=UPI00286DDB98|nr:hypothetical protein [Chamaesiphon sp. VAR_69_metabat_338]